MKPTHYARILFLVTVFFISSFGQAQQPAIKPVQTGYAPVNGLKMYYEVYGSGKPLVLLHGAYMTISSNWSDLLPELSKTRKVIAVEMQGHGHTADIDRPFSYTALADDVAKTLAHLKVDSADVIGYSFGGTVAIELAIKHPALVNKLVLLSTVYKYEGWQPEVREVLKTFQPEIFENTPIKTEYDKVAPDPTHFKAFVKKFMDFDTKSFTLGTEHIKKIQSPVLFVKGDNDGVDIHHVIEMYKAWGGFVFSDMTGLPPSQLAILPGKGHVTLMIDTPMLLSVIAPFLEGRVTTMQF